MTWASHRKLSRVGLKVYQRDVTAPIGPTVINVVLPLMIAGYPEDVQKAQAQRLLKHVKLAEYTHKYPLELSGGEQQRVAISRALINNPPIMIADEPTANLDSKSTANLIDIMSRLNREENITFIFSTHDQRVIDRARRVVTLVDGKIINDRNE